MKDKRFYRRNLPHWQPEGVAFSICIRLSGSLPLEKILQLKEEKALNSQNWTVPDWDNYFLKYDELLDSECAGPVWMKEDEIASIIKEALHFRDGSEFRLIAYCLMANHLHLIVDQCSKILFRILQSFKRYTARRANILLKRTGQPFWAKESYDHIIRNDVDMENQMRYLINNPVKCNNQYLILRTPFTRLNFI